MDGWMDEQAGSRGTSKQGSCPFVFWAGHSSRQQLEDDSDVDEEEGRSRALGCTPSAQMTAIHTNIPVQVREGATNSQQMEVVQGRRALVLEALARSVWCIVEERFTQRRQRTHPWIEKMFSDTFRCCLRQNDRQEKC